MKKNFASLLSMICSSGATIYEAFGAYNMDKRHEIITIVDKNEYQKLMSYINKTRS